MKSAGERVVKGRAKMVWEGDRCKSKRVVASPRFVRGVVLHLENIGGYEVLGRQHAQSDETKKRERVGDESSCVAHQKTHPPDTRS